MAATPEPGGGDLEVKAVEHIYNHLFMPMKLPQSNDWDDKHEEALLRLVTAGIKSLRECPDLSIADRGHLLDAVSLLNSMRFAHADGLSEGDIRGILQDIDERNSAVPLHIAAQNAGVLVAKSKDGKEVRFDVFELSARNGSVIKTAGRLLRSFPAASVAVPIQSFRQPGFTTAIAHTLSSLSNTSVSGMQPTANKSGTAQVEDRDTTHPAMITEVFTGFLSALGTPVKCPELVKKTRDEVLWQQADRPWRRSPRWLLIRVALQLTLSRAAKTKAYKRVMLFVLANALDVLRTSLPIDAMRQTDPFFRDMLHIMVSKVGRRLKKLSGTIETSIVKRVQDIMDRASAALTHAWKAVQARDVRSVDLQVLSQLDFHKDSQVFLLDLEGFIQSTSKREATSLSSNFTPKSTLRIFSPNTLPTITKGDLGTGVDAVANLLRIEQWVAEHCKEWTILHMNELKNCDQLRDLMQDYYLLAVQHYSSNPEALSAMYLTIMELWVAMDLAATTNLPLLCQYQAGIDRDLLQSLLLPTKEQMKRLAEVEQYLELRTSSESFPFALVCADIDSNESFAAKYFDSSPGLQGLLDRITARAANEKAAKELEFERLKEQHEELMAQYHGTDCDEYEARVWRGKNLFYETRHAWKNCRRCIAKKRADKLEIDVHEWPLPARRNATKAVVFELNPPEGFTAWRDGSIFVLKTILKNKYSASAPTGDSKAFKNDPHLEQFNANLAASRITLLSSTKGNIHTHRNALKVSRTRKVEVCLPSGFKYQYYDTDAGAFVTAMETTDAVAKELMYKLPKRSASLQNYLFRPARNPSGPGHNHVIAGQSAAPDHMTLDEYVRLSSLPLGYELQWHGIRMELEAPSVDSKKDETALVILQCIYQAGPSGDHPLRATHRALATEQYGSDMLKNLMTAFGRVKANWESAPSLSIFSAITCRLLELTESTSVADRCIAFLDQLRSTAFLWVELLRLKAQQATEVDRAAFRAKSVDAALICALCADAHGDHLSNIFSNPEIVSTFIQCSIVIQEGKRKYSLPADPVLALVQHRYYRLLARSVHLLGANKQGVQTAVQSSWSAYQPGFSWETVSTAGDHWLTTKTQIEGYDASLTVHYNVLGGELLVNGNTLGRPSDVFEKHPMWTTLFGDAIVEVMPTTLAGMTHSTKRQHVGYTINLGIQKNKDASSDLLLRATSGGRIYELLPPHLFRGKFPEAFTKDFVHFHNVTDDVVEFRPIKTPWASATPASWSLRRSTSIQRAWHLVKGDNVVIGSGSPTAKAIAEVLAPLGDRHRIHCVLSPQPLAPQYPTVEVEIPTIHLGFSLTKGQAMLRSREARNYVVDLDQSVSTLIGFRNKLMLRHVTTNNRIMLVAEGPVSYEADYGHVKVAVAKSTTTRVHQLGVDAKIGRLIDNGSLGCKMFLAYLHSLTSFCLPDPLLGRTGTEEAVTILQSAALKSFDRLSPEETDILKSIAKLTPGRCYYPTFLREMQTVTWDSALSTFSQSTDLLKSVTSIMDHAARNNVFHPETAWVRPSLTRTDAHLMERESIRSSAFRVSGYGAEDHTTTLDDIYGRRDKGQASGKTSNAHHISVALLDRLRHYKIPSATSLWHKISSLPMIYGPDNASDRQPIVTCAASLVNQGLDLALMLPLLKSLGAGTASGARTFTDPQLMAWLSYLFVHDDSDGALLQLFASLCTSRTTSNVPLPTFEFAQPTEGYEITTWKIESVLSSCIVPLDEAPEAEYESLGEEELADFDARQRGDYELNQRRAIDSFTKGIYEQRDLVIPTMPDCTDSAVEVCKYLRTSIALDMVKDKFKVWHNNKQLFQYFQRIEYEANALPARAMTLPTWPVVTAKAAPSQPGFASAQSILSGKAPTLPHTTPPLASALQNKVQTTGGLRLNGL